MINLHVLSHLPLVALASALPEVLFIYTQVPLLLITLRFGKTLLDDIVDILLTKMANVFAFYKVDNVLTNVLTAVAYSFNRPC